MRRCLLISLMFCGSFGCSLKSRYAMDNPKYAEKYEEGASKDDLLGKAKQAFDARHTQDMGGLYIGAGSQVRPASGESLFGADVGFEHYARNWITFRGSLGFYIGEDEGFGGADVGVRFQTPSRIAPFVGVGLFTGGSRGDELADRDNIDNDDDGFTDESGERESHVDGWLTAVYPEVGVHAWLNGKTRLTAFGRYFVSSEGRDQDDWLIGGQVTIFTSW